MIKGVIIGDKEVMARFDNFAGKLRDELKTGIGRAALAVQRNVVDVKLAGAALNVRTGRLWRSINVKTTETGNSITASIGTNVSYGAAWEFGFRRKIGAGARGWLASSVSNARATYYIARHPPGTKSYAERSFLRSALADMEDTIRSEFEQAVARAVRVA